MCFNDRTFYRSLVTWHNCRCLIHEFNQSRWCSLKSGGIWRHLIGRRFILKQFNLSCLSKELEWLRLNAPDGLPWTNGCILNARWRSNDKRYMTLLLHRWREKNLNAPFSIEWTGLDDDDGFIDWRWRDKSNGHAQFFLYKRIFFNDVNHSWMFRAIKLFRYLNPWISCFPPLLDSFPHPKSVWKWESREFVS